MALTDVAKIVPGPILDTAADTFVTAQRWRGENEFSFPANGHEFRFSYKDKREFSFFFLAIQGDATGREEVPLDLLEFAGGHDVILDIGAHFGLYSVIFGVQNPDADIYAFEPDQSNAAVCERQVALNGLDVTVKKAAVSDFDGDAELALSNADNAGLNWFEDSVGHSLSDGAEPAHTTTVPVQSISSILDEIDADRPFVKVDAEGAEYQIMAELLERDEPIRGFVELHPDLISDGSAFEIILWLEENGMEYDIVKDRVPTRPGLLFESAD